MYHEGQSFQPSCDTYCQCRGGGVSCVPACPLVARRPTPDCPRPQYIRLSGKCCKEWVCENLENTVIQDAITGKIVEMSPLARVSIGILNKDSNANTVCQSLTLGNKKVSQTLRKYTYFAVLACCKKWNHF